MDNTGSVDEVRMPLVAHVAPISRSLHRSDTSYHSDLPEPHEQRDLPEVYIPLILQNKQANLPCPPKSAAPDEESRSKGKATGVHRRSCWRRHWMALVVLGTVLVAGAIGGALAGVLMSRRSDSNAKASADLDVSKLSTTLSPSLETEGPREMSRTTLLSASQSAPLLAVPTQDSEVIETITESSGAQSTRPTVLTSTQAPRTTPKTEPGSSQTSNAVSEGSEVPHGDSAESASKIAGEDVSAAAGDPDSSSSNELSAPSSQPAVMVPNIGSDHNTSTESAEIPSPTPLPPVNILDLKLNPAGSPGATPSPTMPLTEPTPQPTDMVSPTVQPDTASVSAEQQQETINNVTHRPLMIGRRRELGAIDDSMEIAFYPGQECSYTLISKYGVYPCNLPFEMGEQWYTWQGCGGPVWLELAPPNRKFVGPCDYIHNYATVNCGDFDVMGGWICD
ncbi:hypothetical protein QBC38DRAFT_199572 [Podospora fimiseda]|uniref:Uncharacterized protein n=1 Tax=Podospora fimiseda TaxID=252190 RepID=A0AAN7GYJ9_9PEZI|nr:hypothetical protein QBC38DRAFT_199572 [Podospora fimiseda]